MPGNNPIFKADDPARRQNSLAAGGLPTISENLNSVRAYSWELHFTFPPSITVEETPLVLAAKQVSEAGIAVGDIEVHRVNDKVFYPGRPEQDELTVTFDNMYNGTPAVVLWEWFKTIYNPMSGEYATGVNGGFSGGFKAPRVSVIQLDNKGNPFTSTDYFGVYPRSWKGAEFNYGTGEFHTVSVAFRYDFIDHNASQLGDQGPATGIPGAFNPNAAAGIG